MRGNEAKSDSTHLITHPYKLVIILLLAQEMHQNGIRISEHVANVTLPRLHT